VGQPVVQGSTASGARVQGIDTMKDAVAALPPVLDSNTIGVIHHHLTNLLAGTTSPTLVTTAHVPTGSPDFAHSSGPAASLAQWRTARHPDHGPHIVRPPVTTVPRPGLRKKPGCLGVLFRLALMIFILGVLLNVLSQLTPQPQGPAVPTPAIMSTLPDP
jgi:hypothetical protein